MELVMSNTTLMTSDENPAPQKITKPCRYCCSDIPLEAIVCTNCKYSQSFIRNQITLLAGLGGLVALITYVISSFSDVRKGLFWSDALNIISVNSDSDVIVQNAGDGDVYVSGLEYSAAVQNMQVSGAFALGKVVSPGKFEKIDLGAPRKIATSANLCESDL
jgi:hypothetical protein